MRILFVLAYYYPYIGGAEHIFKQLAEGLTLCGHSVKVMTSQLPGTPDSEVINGVDIERIKVPRFYDRCFFAVLNLPHIIQQVRDYDLIHTASNNISMPVSLIGRMFGKPVVFTCHEYLGKRWKLVEPHPLKSWLFRTVEKMVVTHPYDRYVAVSHSTLGDLQRAGIDPSLTTVVYNGVDEIFSANMQGDGKLRAMLGLDADEFVYLYYGRVGVTKGVEYLVKAAPLIQKKIPGAHLILVLSQEPGKQYSHICEMVNALVPDVHIHLVPRTHDRKQLVRYLLDANCVVIPSITEGFGLTTAEACMLGVPVVASRVGSIPEIVSGRHILVNPGQPEAICEGVMQAFHGHYDGWKPKKQFSWERMVLDYEEVYETLLAKRVEVGGTNLARQRR